MLGIEWKYQGRFGKLVSESAGMETTMEVPGIAFPAIAALANVREKYLQSNTAYLGQMGSKMGRQSL